MDFAQKDFIIIKTKRNVYDASSKQMSFSWRPRASFYEIFNLNFKKIGNVQQYEEESL